MRHRCAFTLVELVIVVLILGILAGVAVGRFRDIADDGAKATLQTAVDLLIDQVEMRTAKGGGTPPPTILPAWFHGARLPPNPYNDWGIAQLEVVSNASQSHPAAVVIHKGSAGAYWYNRRTRQVRARVPWQGSRAATLDFYNEVNDANLGDTAAAEPPTGTST